MEKTIDSQRGSDTATPPALATRPIGAQADDDAPPDLTVAQLFAHQVARNPDGVALEAGADTWTYAQVAARTGDVARHLTAAGVGPGDTVAVLMRRSPDLIVALLAVAEVGAAYVPLDPRYPVLRMQRIIAGARCAALLVDSQTGRHDIAGRVPTLTVGGEPGTQNETDAVPVRATDPEAVLYVMHTSGSTGESKGVLTTHRNVVALATDRIWRGGAHERVLFHSPQAFDASTYEIWVPLLSGGRVVVATEDVNAVMLRKLAGEGRITALWLTAGLFSALAEGDPSCLRGVRQVWTGGDVVSAHAVRRVVAVCPDITVFNGYGPTETTTFATRYQIHPGPDVSADVPIGTPMDHTRLYVLDEGRRPVPPGAEGQLYVAGAGVARGYLGAPELTAERFLPDPFGAPDQTMYATGDLVRWDDAGRLRYRGRVDDQVKINGFRVEPGEVEAALAAHPAVSRAAVVACRRDGGTGFLAAYVVAAGARSDGADLRDHLAERLPAYLVPARVTVLDELPLTDNGKVDRQRLREMAAVPATADRPDPAGGTGIASVHGLVEQVVRRQPEVCAVHDPVAGRSLTYAELWQRAGALAGALTAAGVGRGDIVAVDLGRSVDLVVAFLGIVRAGAAYLPLDTQAPAKRVAAIVAESGAAAVVVGPDGTSNRMPATVRTVPADAAGSFVTPECEAGGEDLVYVTYTSGSTGRPKGVMVPHRAVIRLVTGAEYCSIQAGERVANTCNPAFDVTTCEIWSTLTAGGTVVPFPSITDLGLEAWTTLICDGAVTTMFLTTSVFHTVAWERPGAFATLGNLVVGGEQLDLAAVQRIRAAGPPQRLVNGYGPTEATAFASWFLCDKASLAGRQRIPIGFPLQQTTLFILDDDLAEVADGQQGELCIGGPGVARGYLNRDDLTADRFVTEPRTGERVYRTGDLVRRLPDGALEMLGRRDRQVKLRGFRIELEEIEQAVVATRLAGAAFVEKVGEGTAAELVAAVLPDGDCPVPADELPGALTARLAERLPPYMLPARWLVLSELPLGSTGKADRASILAQLTGEAAAVPHDGGAALITPTEHRLAELWSELLEVPVTSRDVSFWEIGGHSLRGVTLVARLRDRLGVHLRLRDLFRHPRLGDLAALIDAAGTVDAQPPAPPSAAPVDLPASDFQRRVWVAQRLDDEPGLYNVPMAWRVDGRLDPQRLAAALARTVQRHEALRTTFRERGGELRQLVSAPWQPVVRRDSCDDAAALDRLLRAEADQPFDVERGPLLRAGLVDTPDGQVLMLILHHLVCDLSSRETLVAELGRFYRHPDAPAPDVRQYRDVVPPDAPVDAGALARQVGRLRDAPARLPLGTAEPGGAHGSVPMTFPADLLRRMRPLQNDLGMSWFMVASAALAGTLHRWTGLDDLTFGFPTDLRSSEAAAEVIGPCLNMVVVRSHRTGDGTARDLLEHTRDAVLEALEDGTVTFGAVLDALNPPRAAGSIPFLDVVLAPQVQSATTSTVGECVLTPLPTVARTGTVGKFAITVGLTVAGDQMTGELLYRGDRLTADQAAALARAYPQALEGVLAEPDRPLPVGLPTVPAGPPADTPAPAARAVAGPVSGGAGSGRMAERVAAIWATALGVDRVGPHDNFFDLGGTSLQLVRLHAELCREFAVELPIQRLFDAATVQSMVDFLQQPDITAAPAATAAAQRGDQRRRALHRRAGLR